MTRSASALLQTAGLLARRVVTRCRFSRQRRKEDRRVRGCTRIRFILYEAFREQVTVTPIDEVVDANYTHNYNNGNLPEQRHQHLDGR